MACCSVAFVDPLNCLHRKSSGLTTASYHNFIASNLQGKQKISKKLGIKENPFFWATSLKCAIRSCLEIRADGRIQSFSKEGWWGFNKNRRVVDRGGPCFLVAPYRSILISARGRLRDNLKWSEVIISDPMLYSNSLSINFCLLYFIAGKMEVIIPSFIYTQVYLVFKSSFTLYLIFIATIDTFNCSGKKNPLKQFYIYRGVTEYPRKLSCNAVSYVT